MCPSLECVPLSQTVLSAHIFIYGMDKYYSI